MSDAEVQTVKLVLDVVDTVGSIGLLALLTYAFFRGLIVPKAVIHDIVISLSSELLQGINERLDKLSDANQRGGW